MAYSSSVKVRQEQSKVTKSTKRRRGLSKGRSIVTFQNKLRKVKKLYNLTFKNSKKRKKQYESSSTKKKGTFFCDKYPNEKSYLDTIKIKEATKNA